MPRGTERVKAVCRLVQARAFIPATERSVDVAKLADGPRVARVEAHCFLRIAFCRRPIPIVDVVHVCQTLVSDTRVWIKLESTLCQLPSLFKTRGWLNVTQRGLYCVIPRKPFDCRN